MVKKSPVNQTGTTSVHLQDGYIEIIVGLFLALFMSLHHDDEVTLIFSPSR